MRTMLLIVGLLAMITATATAQKASTKAAATAASASASPVNLNTATQTQLEALPGIGAKAAQRIIEYQAEERRVQEDRRPDERQGRGREELLEAEAAHHRRGREGPGVTRHPYGRPWLRAADSTGRGFTLTELVLALAMMSILAAVTIPTGLRMLDD